MKAEGHPRISINVRFLRSLKNNAYENFVNLHQHTVATDSNKRLDRALMVVFF